MRTHLARGSRILAVTAALALAIGLAPAGVAQAKEKECGWSGNVIPLMERADRRVRSKQVTARIREKFGADVTVATYTRMEVDLQTAPGTSTRPTEAATIAASRERTGLKFDIPAAFTVRSAALSRSPNSLRTNPNSWRYWKSHRAKRTTSSYWDTPRGILDFTYKLLVASSDV